MMKLKSISTEGSCQNPIAVGAATAIVAGFNNYCRFYQFFYNQEFYTSIHRHRVSECWVLNVCTRYDAEALLHCSSSELGFRLSPANLIRIFFNFIKNW